MCVKFRLNSWRTVNTLHVNLIDLLKKSFLVPFDPWIDSLDDCFAFSAIGFMRGLTTHKTPMDHTKGQCNGFLIRH